MSHDSHIYAGALLVCLSGTAAAIITAPTTAPLPRLSAPAQFAPLAEVRPSALPPAPAPQLEAAPRYPTRLVNRAYLRPWAGPRGGVAVIDDVVVGADLALRPDQAARAPWVGAWLATLRQTIDCGVAGSLWTDGTTQSLTGTVAVGGDITVDGGLLAAAPNFSPPAPLRVESGGALCVLATTAYSRTPSTWTCTCPAPQGALPTQYGAWDAADHHVGCDADYFDPVTEEAVLFGSCTRIAPGTPTDGTTALPSTGVEWIVSAPMPAPILVDGSVDLAAAPLTISGSRVPPVGALLLRAGAITGTLGAITAPAGITVAVVGADLHVAAAP
jgi:hypothetical protein